MIENGPAKVVQSYRGFDDLEAIFIHIPKTAGTSISHALFGTEVGHARAHELRLIFGRDFWRFATFTFVRNPFDRLVSAYEYLKRGGHPAFSGDQTFSREVVARYPSFARFVVDWLTRSTMRTQVHFLEQTDFITLDGAVVPDFIGRFECLEEDFGVLCRRLGVRATLPTLNQTLPRDLEAYYTDDAVVRRVVDLYEDDFAVGGYGVRIP